MFRKLLLALAAVCLMTGSAVAADAFPEPPDHHRRALRGRRRNRPRGPYACGWHEQGTQAGHGRAEYRRRIRRRRDKRRHRGQADGYTLGVTPSAPLAMHPHMRKVPYTLDSFDFVGRILKAPYIVMVAKTAPWNTLDDMLRDMKANPNTFFFASSGVGSVPYFAMMDPSSRRPGRRSATSPSPATPTPSRPSRGTACRSTPPPPDRWISMTSRGWPSWMPPVIRCCPTCPR